MPGLIERIQAKIELFRLEQRYTRRRHRRSTFVSNAVYVDGEYIYQTPASTGSSTNTSSTSQSHSQSSSPTTAAATSPTSDKPSKRMNRLSAMPGFGSLSRASGQTAAQDWRGQNEGVGEAR